MTDNELFFWAIGIIILAIVVLFCMDQDVTDEKEPNESTANDRYNESNKISGLKPQDPEGAVKNRMTLE